MRMRQHKFRGSRGEHGYILLTLMLFVALLAIGAVVVVPSLTFQVQRDREEELIHRGVQYSRGIRRYFKKFGRYPTSLDDLKNTNNIRFLRKRYKDPITGKDFKLLHFGEVQMFMGGGVAGATPVSAMVDANKTDDQAGDKEAKKADATSSSASTSPQVFGGGPIVGVISTSKETTIREFNGKNHYNQWQFIYDPGTDRPGLLNTPAQPPLQSAIPPPLPPSNGSSNTNSSTGGSFGSNSGTAGTPPAPDQNTPPAQPNP